MKKFVANSENSKNALKMAGLASTLPVNIVIVGEVGVGKKLLARVVSASAYMIDIIKLEKMIKDNKINLLEYSELIITNIENANNLTQLVRNLDEMNIKIIATSSIEKDFFSELFLVKIDISPLSQRVEDVIELQKNFISKAKEAFSIEFDVNDIAIDLSTNGISLKKSIYKSLLFNSVSENELMSIVENYLLKEFDSNSSYSDLLRVFEIPLLRAAKKKYSSQLQMAKNLELNRVTLRKKIDKYGVGDE